MVYRELRKRLAERFPALNRLWKLQRNTAEIGAEIGMETSNNRYARDWNSYSQAWDQGYSGRYAYLGDEWNDDGTEARLRDDHYFRSYAERFLRPDMTVLEVGPGGGKWTVRIAPLVKRVVVLDVADEMLRRTRERCDMLGLTNVEYVQGNGLDFRPIDGQTIDLFFSYDVFVHIALEDTFPYAGEIARVLKPDGLSVCHYAVGSTPGAMQRIEQHGWWYRGQANTLGQYYYFSPEMLRRMYEHVGLHVLETHQEWCYCVVIASRLSGSLVAQLEATLRAVIASPADSDERSAAIAHLERLPGILAEQMQQLTERLLAASTPQDTIVAAQAVRRLWRGL